MQQDCVPQARLYICICGDNTEQCGHVGVNHATALGNASHSHLLAQNLCLCKTVTLSASLQVREMQIAEHVEVALSLQAVSIISRAKREVFPQPKGAIQLNPTWSALFRGD